MSPPLLKGIPAMDAHAINDMTLDELRPVLARAVPVDAAFDGWGEKALLSAAARLGLNPDIAGLVFPGGAVEMIDAWFESVDADMAERLPAETLATLKIRERISALVLARLDIMRPQREALRRAQAILAMPQNAKRTLSLGWRAADAMWRAAGDTATDYNHYTKRAILGAVYASTALIFVNDESEGDADTRAFLDRRIDGIMRFEKAKAKWTGGGSTSGVDRHFSMARFLGRLRYPV
jgi:ubiquinone biosynthesis protein COQ9